MRNMKRSFGIISALAAIALLAVSCGVVSFTGRKQMLLFSDSEISAMSNTSYTEFMSTAKISTNKEATQMLLEVGNRMVAALDSYTKTQGKNTSHKSPAWEFQLVESPEVNAFCLPTGKIIFYEGILQFADRPEYIAVVMGHEMGHVIANHGNERMSQQSAINLLGQIASEAIGNKSGSTAQSLFDLGFGLGTQAGLLLPFSRKHEYEADKIGVHLMEIAGYDINAAPKFWERMMEGSRSSNIDFFSTHPSDAKRISALKGVIETIESSR